MIEGKFETAVVWNALGANFLGHMLQSAEGLYGPRDHAWTFLGITYGDGGPQIRFPVDGNYISIELLTEVIGDPQRTVYQLAHETVHLLAPQRGLNAPVIEEGIATHFSLTYQSIVPGYSQYAARQEQNVLSTPYAPALSATRELLALNGDAIRLLRQREPAFYKFTPDLIRQVVPEATDDLAEVLCSRFSGYRGEEQPAA